ncbi:MAG: hypothetical protein ACE5GC_05365 [Acidimicrobiia bacterium]
MLNEVLPPEERAIEAVVARYQRVAPAITRFARTLSGNERLTVRLGSQASVAEDEIVVDPGVFQAAYARSAPVTPTEVALTSALHEVVHLAVTDFEEKRPLPRSWIPEPVAEAPEREPIRDTLSLFPDAPADASPPPDEDPVDPGAPVSLLDALDRAGGRAAEALFLSLEDARQEWRYFTPYPGARSVLADLYRASVRDAMADARPLGQFALSAFLLVGGYLGRDDLERRVRPHVAAALSDASDVIASIRDAADPWNVGGAALDLLAIARRHGLVTEVEATDSATLRSDKDEADGSAIAKSVDAVRMVTPPLATVESYDRTRDAAQAVAARDGRAGDVDQAGDPATDQLVRVSEAPTVYLPTGQGGKLVVTGFPDRFRAFGHDGARLIAEAARKWQVAERSVGGELYPLFLANQRRGLRSGYDAGDLTPYAALLLGGGLYERMFERRDLPTRRSYALSLLVDGSASMLQPRTSGETRKSAWALAAATLGAWTLARLCNELQIDFEVALFNRSFAAAPDDTETSYTDRRHRATGALRRGYGGAAERLTRTVNHYLVKSFDDRWRRAEDMLAGLFLTAASPTDAARRARLDPDGTPPVSMFDKAANVDEFNVSFAAGRLAGRNVSTRILVVLADGMTRGSVQSLAEAVDAVQASGTVVLGIGIGDETVMAAYGRNQVVERPEDLAGAMVDGVRSTLYQTIATMGGDTWWAHGSERVFYDHPTLRRVNA